MKLTQHTWDLLIRALKGALGPVARREFDAWMEDSDNRQFYANLAKTWDGIQRRASVCPLDRDRLWNELQQRISVAKPAPSKSQRNWRMPLQMAAAIVTTAIVVLSAVMIVGPAEPQADAEQLFTAIDGKSQAQLTDGSVVWLNRGSSLVYNNRFGDRSRDVKLYGEAFFDIAKDAERPFTVRVEGLNIRVHGTKFNVRSLPVNGIVSVSLIEGSVALETPKHIHRTLRPGQIAAYNIRSQNLSITQGDVAMESCWADGKISFEQESLGEICRYLSRWYSTEIYISPSITRRYAYTFTITNEPLEEILRIMGRINPITYTFSEDNTVAITEL